MDLNVYTSVFTHLKSLICQVFTISHSHLALTVQLIFNLKKDFWSKNDRYTCTNPNGNTRISIRFYFCYYYSIKVQLPVPWEFLRNTGAFYSWRTLQFSVDYELNPAGRNEEHSSPIRSLQLKSDPHWSDQLHWTYYHCSWTFFGQNKYFYWYLFTSTKTEDQTNTALNL